jgi:hypothetical protein
MMNVPDRWVENNIFTVSRFNRRENIHNSKNEQATAIFKVTRRAWSPIPCSGYPAIVALDAVGDSQFLGLGSKP